jgi:ubiquinone/menaquinone biosynthesis C-methylase UbiE
MSDRFARTAGRLARLQDARADALAARIRELVPPSPDARALDSGTGAGALAFALAPLVHEVVGVDVEPALLDEARRRAPANVSFMQADAAALPFPDASFDLAGTLRTLHHVADPDRVVAELARVTLVGGLVLVADQLAPEDAAAAERLNRFERTRDPSTHRVLTDAELRELFAASGLTVRTASLEREERELEPYLDLAACAGAARAAARELAPVPFVAELGWYVLERVRRRRASATAR